MDSTNKKDQHAGERFGRLTVIRSINPEECKSRLKVLCRCDCGNEKVLAYKAIAYGNTSSCGCLRTTTAKAMNARRTEISETDCLECRWYSVGKVYPVHICHARRKNTDYKIITDSHIERGGCTFFMSNRHGKNRNI